jgi:ubiquinone/menaquinone biosynthesis C-methylase UbiE
MIPGIKVAGLDVSEYAINKAMDGYVNYLITKQGLGEEEAKKKEEEARKKVLPHMIVGNCEKLPWPDNSFDVVLGINTIHNLPVEKCRTAIKEIMRVCKPQGHKFISVDAYRNEEQKQRMECWVLTAETVMSVDEWIKFYEESGYDGDYYWFIA